MRRRVARIVWGAHDPLRTSAGPISCTAASP